MLLVVVVDEDWQGTVGPDNEEVFDDLTGNGFKGYLGWTCKWSGLRGKWRVRKLRERYRQLPRKSSQ